MELALGLMGGGVVLAGIGVTLASIAANRRSGRRTGGAPLSMRDSAVDDLLTTLPTTTSSGGGGSGGFWDGLSSHRGSGGGSVSDVFN